MNLNTDVAEGAGIDDQLIPLVGSANICCGAHAGGEEEMRAAVSLCLKHGVKIGAHPGYPDRENMGRKDVEISLEDLSSTVIQQLERLDALVTELGGKLSYIKPHGAFYNRMAQDYEFACEMMEVFQDWRALPIVVLAGSEAEDAARDLGLPMITEGFIDRGYTKDGLLVPRSEPGAMITDIHRARHQAQALINGTEFPSSDGTPLKIKTETVCVHGDTKEALGFLEALLETT